MPSISVRQLDPETHQRLRERAAKLGTSMEELARRILTDALAAPDRLGDLFLRQFGRSNGVELEELPRNGHEPLDLES